METVMNPRFLPKEGVGVLLKMLLEDSLQLPAPAGLVSTVKTGIFHVILISHSPY